MLKKSTNLIDFKNILPFDSELFGVYQPLLGWKSERTLRRFRRGYAHDRRRLISLLQSRYRGIYKLTGVEGHVREIEYIHPGEQPGAVKGFGSFLLQAIASELPPFEDYKPDMWPEFIEREKLDKLLNTVVREACMKWYAQLLQQQNGNLMVSVRLSASAASEALEKKVGEESVIAGMLLYLANNKLYDQLQQLFYKTDTDLDLLLQALYASDPFETMDPKKDLDRVGLSPIGIVHLFRQYFFEFDTFLGPPVGHVWLSPGSSVELIEVSTRKTTVERSIEQSTESTTRSELSTTDQDELSDSVKEDNRTDTKFGANANAKESWIWGSAEQSASFDMGTTQQKAREQSHKHMRQQTEKLSTEIRKNFKSTFKTVTETTETSSKRYVLANDGDQLINYEFRRKMRQVAVQVQDIGTYLCWQTYVDEPGKQLGVAELMHIAASPDVANMPHPEAVMPPGMVMTDYPIDISFVQTSEDEGDKDEGYTNGKEEDTDFNEGDIETIQADFPQTVISQQAGYMLQKVSFDTSGGDIQLSVKDLTQAPNSTEAKFTVHVNHVNFRGSSPIRVMAKLTWMPDATIVKDIEDQNKANVSAFTARLEQEYRKEFVEAAKERIKLASRIRSRSFEDLREEERIVVYRVLIQELLTKGIPFPDNRTRHAAAELLNSIFDVDKMLYFVAPEWWKPRDHSHQSFGTLVPNGQIGPDGQPVMVPDVASSIPADSLTGWGGMNEKRHDNYYITDESDPAKLGSSLGWLLQLDGDNLRNAFLNAPWVKAVIPIRPGKEKAAMNWLKQVEGMNGIGPSDMYGGTEPDLQGKTMLEVLDLLSEKVKAKHDKSIQTTQYPDPDNPGDPASTVSATPVDKVYEHGFYPLQGGFHAAMGDDFEVFDQWIEVLPTDQVVAVEVKYDPKTGRQI